MYMHVYEAIYVYTYIVQQSILCLGQQLSLAKNKQTAATLVLYVSHLRKFSLLDRPALSIRVK